jgi:predicted permease
MKALRRFFTRVHNFVTRRHNDDRLREEIEDHIALATAENLRAGLSPGEARRQALLKFGAIESMKEDYRAERGLVFLDTFLQDLRHALRMLRKSPGFTVVAVLTLALGIGGNVAVFSLLNQTLLRSLPVQDPDRLALLKYSGIKSGTTEDMDIPVTFSYPMYKDLREKSRVFSGLLACEPYAQVNVSWHGQPRRSGAELVSGNYFQVLGVRPALGRLFSQDDETSPGANPVVVLSYRYWWEHFGGDPSVLNQTVQVNATPMTVVGVAQPGFSGVQLGMAPDLYIPLTMRPQIQNSSDLAGLDNVSDYFLELLGRLKPGLTPAQAQAELQPAFHTILESEVAAVRAAKMINSKEEQQRFVNLGKLALAPGEQGRPMLQQIVQRPLTLIMAMVGLVLLIACANLANLLLARGEARQHEIAVRLTMGATRRRLVRQFLTETLIVAIAGGAASLFVAWWILRYALSAIPSVLTPFFGGLTASLDPRVLAFAAGVTVLSAVVFGLVPAMKASRADLQDSLKEQGPGTSGGPGGVRLRKVLVILQVASTVTLLVAAGLFGESLIRVERTNLGMSIGRVVQFSLDPGLSHYSPAQTLALSSRLRRDIAALPGVASVGAAVIPLLANANTTATMKFQGYVPRSGDDLTMSLNWVTPQFFSTLGIPLLQGREFRESDSASALGVAVINEFVASKFFARRSPLGMHLAIGWAPDLQPDVEIVGVVGNTKSSDAHEDGQGFVYFPYAQNSGASSATFYVRARTLPRGVEGEVLGVVAKDAANLPIYNVRTLPEQFSDSLVFDRLISLFTLSLALLAALLAVVGLYGLMAYGVIRRTREFAIRMALGATRLNVLAPVLRQGIQLTLIGILIGIAAAFAVARLVGSLLYDVKPSDPLVFAVVPLLLIVVTLFASYIPARRAMRVDPIFALRHE